MASGQDDPWEHSPAAKGFQGDLAVSGRSTLMVHSCYWGDGGVVPSSAHTGLFWGASEEAELGSVMVELSVSVRLFKENGLLMAKERLWAWAYLR